MYCNPKWMTIRTSFVALVFLIGYRASAGSVLFVDDDAVAGGDGESWNTAYRFLQDALAIASIPEKGIAEIRVAQGTYQPDRDEANPQGTGDREATFLLVKDVTLMGGYAGIGAEDPDARDIEAFETIFSGDLLGDDGPPGKFKNNKDNSYTVTTGGSYGDSTTIDGCSIMGGNSNGNLFSTNRGGGFWSQQGTLNAIDCKFISNTAMVIGGAAFISFGNFINCTFEHNDSEILGGAIGSEIIWSHNLSTVNCVFRNNTAGDGGAVYINLMVAAEIIGCEFDGNTALSDGGAVNSWGPGLTSLVDCTFTNNQTVYWGGRGGAVALYSSSNELIRCVVIGNTATEAGALFIYKDAFIDGCLFLDNTSLLNAGAVQCFDDATIINSIFANNSSGSVGGAIAHISNVQGSQGTLNFNNNTVVGNTAEITGGGLHVGHSGGNNLSTVDMSNCIVWGNTVAGVNDEEAQISATDNGEVIVNYSSVQGLTGKLGGLGNIGVNPLFIKIDSGDFHLSPDSPCIDAGDNLAVLKGITTDLDGNPRFVDDPDTKDTGNGDSPIVDMGAYEFQLVLCPWDLDDSGSVGTGDLLELFSQWGTDGLADFDGNGFVNESDLLILLANWGPCG